MINKYQIYTDQYTVPYKEIYNNDSKFVLFISWVDRNFVNFSRWA